MNPTGIAPFLIAGLFAGMLLLFELGRRLGQRERASRREGDESLGLGALEGAIFTLFGLLIAFTFSGAMQRFDALRSLIAKEANAVGTAYLRLDLLPKEAQPELRERFRDYVDARLGFYQKIWDPEASKAQREKAKNLQNEIWSRAITASALPGAHPDAAKLVLPALNDMIDMTTTRQMAAKLHPPKIIFILLFVLGLGCALFAGYGTAGSARSWVHILGFAAATVVTVYVIFDIEYPRAGSIRVDPYDQVLIDLRNDMK